MEGGLLGAPACRRGLSLSEPKVQVGRQEVRLRRHKFYAYTTATKPNSLLYKYRFKKADLCEHARNSSIILPDFQVLNNFERSKIKRLFYCLGWLLAVRIEGLRISVVFVLLFDRSRFGIPKTEVF